MLRNLLSSIFSPWVLLGAVVIAVLIVGGVISLLFTTRAGVSAPGVPTAVMVVIPAPSSTPSGVLMPTEGVTATPPVPASPAPGVIAVGASVEISGTGGEGLKLREVPGLNGKIRYLGFEAEVFVVQEGPQVVDGLTWWYLVGFFDASRSGWAASNYLEVIQNP